jgi:hypothetical protein
MASKIAKKRRTTASGRRSSRALRQIHFEAEPAARQPHLRRPMSTAPE